MLGTAVVRTLCFGALALGTITVAAQNYPTRPIRIVTSEVGGGADFSSRIIAQGISAPLGQPVVIDNRGGILPGVIVAKSLADGYTLLFQSNALWISPL